MNEYLLLIRTNGDYCENMSAEQHKQHLAQVSNYIQRLKQTKKIREAQPLSMTGTMLHGNKGVFKDGPFIESKEVIIGYYLVWADDINGALEIAKANPVFECTDARIEIREIKREEGVN